MTKIFKQLARHWAVCLVVFALLFVQDTYFCSICFRVSTLGTLWSMASIMTPTVSCS